MFSLANYRWGAIQSIENFHETAGVYRDTNLDNELLELAMAIAETIGHNADPLETRKRLQEKLGLQVFACGKGGHLVCRKSSYYPVRLFLIRLW
jgi:hypothetical protein